jgi:3-phosphoglycerate kinase
MRNKKILDIGEQTVQLFSERIKKSQVIIWNGPLGLFELPEFAKGTRGIWNAILANTRAQIIVGGGETIASSKTIPGFWEKVGKKKNIFLSTGGGAMLEFLSGEALPGIEALDVE